MGTGTSISIMDDAWVPGSMAYRIQYLVSLHDIRFVADLIEPTIRR